MAKELDMKSARNVMPMRSFVAVHEYSTAELVCKTTSSNKSIHRIRFNGSVEYKISPKAYRKVAEGEIAISDLQYAEYCTEDGDEWVSLFVPAGAEIISEDILAKETF